MPVHKSNRANRALFLLPGATVLLAACSPSAPTAGQAGPAGQSGGTGQTSQQAQPSESYRLTATVQDLMDGIVDPSADVLWDSVAYIATTKGVEDRQPRTDEEWKTVRYSAITLIE